jgi:hypothetical protein
MSGRPARRLALGAALGLVALGAVVAAHGQPRPWGLILGPPQLGQLRVVQEGGAVRFLAFVRDRAGDASAAPADLVGLSVARLGGAGPLWHVRAEGLHAAREVRYGEVPAGFVQELPGAGVAPGLEAGVEYVVVGDLGPMGTLLGASFVARRP